MLKLITHQNKEIFWFKCPACETYIVAEAANEKAKEFSREVCPFCADISREDYPFKFITKEQYTESTWIKDSLQWLENIETM